MLIVFIPLLAALGAAFVLKGRAVRGLLVANATGAAGAAAYGRWNWTAFAVGMCAVSLGGIAAAQGESEPKKTEPKDER